MSAKASKEYRERKAAKGRSPEEQAKLDRSKALGEALTSLRREGLRAYRDKDSMDPEVLDLAIKYF